MIGVIEDNARTYLTQHIVVGVVRSSLDPDSARRLVGIEMYMLALVRAVCASQW